MKKFLKVLGIIVGAIVLIIILAFVFTSGLPKVADTMFTDIKAGNIQQAYLETAGQFQSSTTLEQFQAFIQHAGLANFKNASWTTREIMNNQGLLKGTITLEDGSTLPIEINLIKEEGKRKILSLNIPQGGIINEKTTSDIPSQEEATQLVKNAMKLFIEAVNQKNFTNFYATISQARQQQTTAEELQKAFQVFIDNNIDLSAANNATPEFTATPTIDANGILSIDGQYTFTDATIIFNQKYYKENGIWKLFGFNVQVK